MLQLFLKDVATSQSRRVAAAFGLLIGRGLFEGFGLILLIPLLGLVGFGDTPHQDSAIGRAAGGAIEWFGGSPSLTTILVIFSILVGLRAVLGYGFSVVSSRLCGGYITDLRSGLLDTLVRADWAHISSLARADLIAILVGHTERMAGSVYALIGLVSALVTCAVALVVAAFISPLVTVAVGLAALAVGAALSPFDRRAQRLGQRYAEESQALYRQLSNLLDGLKPAKSAGAEDRLSASFQETASSYSASTIDIEENMARARLLRDLSAAAILVVFVLAVSMAGSGPSIEPVVLIIIFARLFGPAGTIQRDYQEIAATLPIFGKIRELQAAARAAAQHESGPVSPINLERAVKLEAVSLEYPGEDGGEALREVDAVIVAGKITALVGRSGAGKSSLAEVVAGLRLPTRGRISIDGRALDETTIRGWRISVGYVPQEAYLFNDTIRANLLWARREATEDEIWRALETANAADFVRALPDGLDTVLHDMGTRLSGGERQRITLARALLREPALLVLDEATSALGPEDEVRFIEALEGLRDTTSVLLIAHRLSTVACADRILVLEDGRLVEEGTWAELSAISRGRFRAMLDATELP